LEDDTFGYADVTILALLTHFTSAYGTLSCTDLETNRNLLKEACWNPDDEFAHLWMRIKTVRQIATEGGDAISDNTMMELTLGALRQSGVYTHAIQTWDDKPEALQTAANFKIHFDQQEKVRLRSLTAKAAGFHSANEAHAAIPAPHIIPDAVAAAVIPAFLSNDVALYYCWTHGLSKNADHTSASCQHKANDHQDDATLDNRKGGINKINFGKLGKKRA
jgi:hypothetical protein